jgi:hypothetical protein
MERRQAAGFRGSDADLPQIRGMNAGNDWA